MDKRIAANGLNFILSKRFNYNGEDFMPLVEFVRELQAIVGDGTESNPKDRATKDKGSGRPVAKST